MNAFAARGAVGVDRARDQLLAGPGLAAHQDVGLGARGLLDQVEDLGHGRAAADDVFQTEGGRELRAKILVLDAERALPQRTLDVDRELVDREVLRQIIERPRLDRGDRRLDAAERGDHDDGQRGIELVRAPHELHAVDSRHLEIGEDHVGPFGFNERERALGVGRGEDAIAGAAEDPGAVLHHVGLVVDDEDTTVGHRVEPTMATRGPTFCSEAAGRNAVESLGGDHQRIGERPRFVGIEQRRRVRPELTAVNP
jgi:hypothetical protein